MPSSTEHKTIQSWSYSSLKQFEKCPYSQYLKRIKRVEQPEPEADSPLVRGNAIHKEAEDFVSWETDKFPKSLKKFEEEIKQLREMYEEGMITVEGEWGFDCGWEPCGFTEWGTVWLQVKGDVVIQHDKETFTIIDYKTGKSWGNEVAHVQQGQLYAVALMIMYPDAQSIDVEFWYLDEGKKKRRNYNRSKLIPLMANFDKRGQKMTQETEFKPKPNVMNCKWCSYGVDKGNGKCPYAVSSDL